MAKIEIEADRFEFLKRAFFGWGPDVEVACQKAYREMSRTLYLRAMSEGERVGLRQLVVQLLAQAVRRLAEKEAVDQAIFDRWHYQLCRQIKQTYYRVSAKTRLTYGQIQAWVNESLKYLYVLGEPHISPFVSFFHVTVNQRLFVLLEERFGLLPPEKAWSRWDDYTYYIHYQSKIRQHTAPECPMKWRLRLT